MARLEAAYGDTGSSAAARSSSREGWTRALPYTDDDEAATTRLTPCRAQACRSPAVPSTLTR